MSKKTLAPPVTHQDPEGIKFLSLVKAAYDKAEFSEEEAQRINETWGLADHIAEFFTANRNHNKHENERVASDYTYPKEYRGPKPIKEQIKKVATIFGLDSTGALEYVKNLPELPAGAEGWIAVPSVDALAKKFFPEVTDPAEKYCRAIRLVHKKIAASRTFYNYRDGEIYKDHLWLSARTQEAIGKIAQDQPGDILIIAAQLGMRHRGKSVRCARESFVQNEFGLGSLIIGSFALVHPERFVIWEKLNPNCAGDEFVPFFIGDLGRSPFFSSRGGGVVFYTCRVNDACEYFGSASGFLLPQ